MTHSILVVFSQPTSTLLADFADWLEDHEKAIVRIENGWTDYDYTLARVISDYRTIHETLDYSIKLRVAFNDQKVAAKAMLLWC